MKERNKHIDDIFRESLGDYQETPPADVWSSLEQRLDAPSAKKRPFPFWWMWMIVAVVGIATTAIVAHQLTTSDVAPIAATSATNNKQVPTKNIETNTVDEDENSIPADDNTIKDEQNEANSVEDQSDIPVSQNVLAVNNTKIEKVSSAPVEQKDNKNVATQKPQAPIKEIEVLEEEVAETMPVQAPVVNVQAAVSGVAVSSPLNNVVSTPNVEPIAQPIFSKKKVEEIQLGDSRRNDAISIKQSISVAAATTIPEYVPVMFEDNEEEEAEDISIDVNESPATATQALLASASPALPALANTETTLPKEAPVVPKAETDTGKKKRVKEILPNEKEGFVEFKDTIKRKHKAPVTLPISFGVKAGFQRGVDNTWRADKFVIAPYASYNFSDKLSVMLQPAFLIGNASTANLNNGVNTYYRIVDTSFTQTSRLVRGAVDSSILTPNPPDTVFRKYTYTQVYDSIRVGTMIKNKQLWDVEIPLLLKYKVSKNIALLAGGSLTYSAVLQTEVDVKEYNGLRQEATEEHTQTYFVTQPGQQPPTAPTPQAISSLFTNNGQPFSNYTPTANNNSTTKTFVRYGFMIGVSTTLKDRWMVDLMMLKTGVNSSVVPDKNIQRIYTQPYFRLTVGYKLSK